MADGTQASAIGLHAAWAAKTSSLNPHPDIDGQTRPQRPRSRESGAVAPPAAVEHDDMTMVPMKFYSQDMMIIFMFGTLF